MSFSVIIVTQNNSHVELVTMTSTSLSLSPTSNYLYANSSVFNLSNTNSLPTVNHFYQWIVGVSGVQSSSYNYWNYAYLSIGPNATAPHEIEILFRSDTSIFMTGVKVHVFLVGQNVGTADIANYQVYS